MVIANCEVECILRAKTIQFTCHDGIGSAKNLILSLTEAKAEVLG